MRFRSLILATLAFSVAVLAVCAQVTDKDKTFLKDSTEANWDEISLGKLALEKSKNADVRMFATKMIHDHTMLNESMKPFAMRWNINPPDHKDMMGGAKYAELKMLTGDEFDKHYISSMVADHDEDLKKFDDEIASTHDASYKAALIKARAVVKKHDEMIKGIAAKHHIS